MKYSLDSLCLSKILKYSSREDLVTLYDSCQFFRDFILSHYQMIDNFPIYPNQWKAAFQIHKNFICGFRYVLLTAQPQSGKTGACQAVSYLIKNNRKLGIKKIWFICGMNDNNLKRQQIREFAGLIPGSQILFSKDLQNYLSPEYFNDSLIILDESHFAQCGIEYKSLHSSMVHRFLTHQVGLTLDGDYSKWTGRNLFFLSVSATPMSELVNFLHDENQKAKVILEPGVKYYGFQEMFKSGKVFDAFNIGDDIQRDDLVEVLRRHYRNQRKSGKYKYAIVRFSNTGDGPTYRRRLKAAIDWDIEFICFHSKFMNLRDINQIINKNPSKMTIIEVYHSLRAGIQLNTKNIFLVHDSHRALTDVTAQGLAGRCCGYGKKEHEVEIYCYKKRLATYLKWIENKFEAEFVPNNCYNIKQGYLEQPRSKFRSRVPMSGKMPDQLVNELLEYKKLNRNRYPNFLRSFSHKITSLKFINKIIWNGTQTAGVTILDEANKTTGKTNTWVKFWNPAFKASESNKEGAYFRSCKLPEEVDDFKYIYVNLKKEHPQFGYLIVTSQCRLPDNPKEYLMTTGKEEFHFQNNRNLNDLPVIHFKKKKELTFKKSTQIKLRKPLTFKIKDRDGIRVA